MIPVAKILDDVLVAVVAHLASARTILVRQSVIAL